jgi:opacity protein-like surface antigen
VRRSPAGRLIALNIAPKIALLYQMPPIYDSVGIRINRVRPPARSETLKASLPARIGALPLVAALATAFCSIARADGGEEARTRWGTARLHGVYIAPLGDNHGEGWNECGSGWFGFLDFYSSINANEAGGVVGSFEYVLKRRYGIEAGLAYWNDIVSIYFTTDGTTVEGSPNFIMPTIGFNYHFLAGARTDIYAGALSCLGVIATGLGADIEVSKDFALGLKIGADYCVKTSWSVGAVLQYIDFGEMDFSLLPPGLEGIVCDNGIFGIGSMNFVSLTCGMGYRF